MPRHQSPLFTAFRPSFCLWHIYPYPRALPVKSGYLRWSDRPVHDFDTVGRCGYKLCADHVRRQPWSEKNSRRGGRVDGDEWASFHDEWALLGAGGCEYFGGD